MSLLLTVAGSLALCWEAAHVLDRRRQRRREEMSRWRARQREVAAAVLAPAGAEWPMPPAFSLSGGCEVVVHVNQVGEVFEFPVVEGWDLESIASTVAESAVGSPWT